MGGGNRIGGMKLRDAANLAVRITGVSFHDHLSNPSMLAALHNKAEFDALMLRINRRIHADGGRKVAIFGQYPLHALDTRSHEVLVEVSPDLQLAAIH